MLDKRTPNSQILFMFHINFNDAIYTIKPLKNLFPFLPFWKYTVTLCFPGTNLQRGLILEKVFISPKVSDFIDLKTTLFHLNYDSSCILPLFCQDDNNLNTQELLCTSTLPSFSVIFEHFIFRESDREGEECGEGRETQTNIKYACKAPQDTECEAILQVVLPQRASSL